MRRFLIYILLFSTCGLFGDEKYPERILSLSAAATHILTELGQPPAAIDEYGKIAAGKHPPPVIGKGSAISQEKIAELKIDCAILWYYQRGAEKMLKNKGLRVEMIAAPRLENYPDLIMRLGKLTGKTKRAEKLRADFKAGLKTLKTADEKPLRVYFELYSEWKGAGSESYVGDLLKAAGGCSIIKKTGLISAETVIEKLPEVIFYIEGFTDAEKIASRPGFASIPAVKNRRIYPIKRRLVTEGLAPLEAVKYLKSLMR
jgi:iron complex transport system substrate-binding protein